jgi:hypothetical protein
MIHATVPVPVPVTIIPFLTREVGNTMEGNPWQIEIMQAGIHGSKLPVPREHSLQGEFSQQSAAAEPILQNRC